MSDVWPMRQGLIRTCSVCVNDDASLSHPAEAMFDVQTNGFSSTADLSTWWQSVTWYYLGRRPVVTISLSFGKMFQLQDDLVIIFQSARPQRMLLEKSVDFGETWSSLQYYSRSCRSVWPIKCHSNLEQFITFTLTVTVSIWQNFIFVYVPFSLNLHKPRRETNRSRLYFILLAWIWSS